MSTTHPLPSTQSHPIPTPSHSYRVGVPVGRLESVWRYIPATLLRYVTTLIRFGYAIRSEIGSLVGRIRVLCTKKHWGVDLGPLWETLPDGRLIRNERTDSRSRGTQDLVSVYPWASSIDLQFFLEGFDVGEQFVLGTLGKLTHTTVAASRSSPNQEVPEVTKPQT